MRISSTTRFAVVGLLVQTAMLQADVATFAGEKGKLNGSLQGFDANGIIEWQSPYSKEPLKLLADKLDRVEFSTSAQSEEPTPVQITLRNGDILPVNRVIALEEGNLISETDAAGMLTIPRAAIASAQFGISKQKVLYSGFDNIREWTTGIGKADNWQRNGKGLISSGRSIAARELELPENFILSFELAWETRSPGFQIGFADSLAEDPRKQNLYSFNFDGSGMRISRHAPGDTRARTLAQWPRRPPDFPDNRFTAEIRVDRSKRRLELFIDGESEGLVVDTLMDLPAPVSNGIRINLHTHAGKQSIDMLSVTELNDSRTRHLAEKRGDPGLDCLITTEDDRWSGELLSMGGTAEQTLMVFKTSFANEAWEIPENQISTLFFANNPFDGGPGGKPRYLVEFHNKAKLSAIGCIIQGDEVELIHPLLGDLRIQRKAIKLISRIRG